ncbi:MAG: hypothetical protein KJ880_00545 [Candidatus Omnitrophica bacterium]|nr:hypothetical protein [Candidatus Omnitrophota bacterium]MBU1870121.1 hypothetical protein [Candidatus Omnitrophota bacterium]
MKRIPFLLVFLAFCILPFVLHADSVTLKNGKTYEGKIIKEAKDYIVLEEFFDDDVSIETSFLRQNIAGVKKEDAKDKEKRKIREEAQKASQREEALKAEQKEMARKKALEEAIQQAQSGVGDVQAAENKRVEGLLRLIDKTEHSSQITDKFLNDKNINVRQVAQARKEMLFNKEEPRKATNIHKVKKEVDTRKKAKPVEPKIKSVKKTPKQPARVGKAKYKIISSEDKDYIGEEAMHRKEVSVSVPNLATREQLKWIFAQVLETEQKAGRGKLDGVWIIAYPEATGLKGLPNAYGIWSPLGGWNDYNNIQDKSKYKWEYRFFN